MSIPLLFITPSSAAISVETWDVTGNYDIAFQLTGDPTSYTHDASFTQTGSAVDGSGGYPTGGPYITQWGITNGSISGDTISLSMDYSVGAVGTTMNMTGAIAGDGSMSGTWNDNYDGGTRTGTWQTVSGSAFRFIPEQCDGMTFDNVIEGTNGNDRLEGTSNRDLILGYEGNDRINGGGSSDCLVGGSGIDTISGGTGYDVLTGDDDDDTDLRGGSGNDKIYGGGGNDMLDGGTGSDELSGESGNDELDGGSSNDSLVGGDGDDTANGGSGTDSCSAELIDDCE